MKPLHALFATAVVATVLLPNFAVAQPNDAPTTDTQWLLVPLKNVPHAYMAWLLDSQHNPLPDKAIAPLSQVPTAAKLPRAKSGLFELPAGVASLIPAPTSADARRLVGKQHRTGRAPTAKHRRFSGQAATRSRNQSPGRRYQ